MVVEEEASGSSNGGGGSGSTTGDSNSNDLISTCGHVCVHVHVRVRRFSACACACACVRRRPLSSQGPGRSWLHGQTVDRHGGCWSPDHAVLVQAGADMANGRSTS